MTKTIWILAIAIILVTGIIGTTSNMWAEAVPSDGTVDSEQKISDTEGDFTGVLNNGDTFGRAVAFIGDLDDNGIEDIAVGAPLDDDGGDARGAVWILFMGTDGKVDSFQKISDTEGDFTGVLDSGDGFGTSVAGIGDLDGDGIEDIAVGARSDDDGGLGHGAVWILFLGTDGKVDGFQKISDTEGDFTGVLGFNDFFGTSVAGIGDLDDDGIEDIAVGASLDDGDKGAVWILFMGTDGKVDGFQKISDTEGDFTGVLDFGDLFGFSVAGIGDLDGDGIEDIAVGALEDDDGDSGAGAVWILFMGTDGKVDSFQKISDTEGDFTGVLDKFDNFGGTSIAGIGDLDDDGIEDIAVGARQDDDGGFNRGAVWILFLGTDGKVDGFQKISDTEGGFTGVLDDVDEFGRSIAGIGDLDDDGIEDIVVGAFRDDDGGDNSGAVWILFMAIDEPTIEETILQEVQNIEEKLDDPNHPTSLVSQILGIVTAIQTDITQLLSDTAQILGILQDPNFGLEEIKEEVSSLETAVGADHSFIEENMKIGATKSLSVDVNGGSTFIIGAPDSEFPTPNVEITNPFDPPRDSNIKICVDATSFKGTLGSLVRLKLDVAGDGDFSVHSEATGAQDQGPKKGVVDGKLKNVICRDVAAKEFQLVIINNDGGSKNVEVAIIWNTGNKIIP